MRDASTPTCSCPGHWQLRTGCSRNGSAGRHPAQEHAGKTDGGTGQAGQAGQSFLAGHLAGHLACSSRLSGCSIYKPEVRGAGQVTGREGSTAAARRPEGPNASDDMEWRRILSVQLLSLCQQEVRSQQSYHEILIAIYVKNEPAGWAAATILAVFVLWFLSCLVLHSALSLRTEQLEMQTFTPRSTYARRSELLPNNAYNAPALALPHSIHEFRKPVYVFC